LSGLHAATIVKLNEDELVVLERMTGLSGADKIAQEYAIDAIVVTRGADGASLFISGQRCDVVAPKVEVVDAVGAGDAFSAVIAVAELRRLPLQHAMKVACDVGAFVVTQRGALASLPEHLSNALR